MDTPKTIKASLESVQDMEAYFSIIRGLSRNPIEDEEIEAWSVLNQRMDERYVVGARIKTKDFTDEELAAFNQFYERYPAGMIIRTPDFTEEEVKDWQTWHEKINNMDLQNIKKKVHFLHEEEYVPYEDDNFKPLEKETKGIHAMIYS